MARVLLLTDPGEGHDVAFLLEEEGHALDFLPVLPRAERSKGLRSVAETLSRFTWVVALDRAVLRAFLEVVHQAGTRAQLSRLQWLAADAPTARLIERVGGLPRVPADGKWSAAVSGLLQAEDEVLVLHRGELPEVLSDSLEASGAQHLPVEVPVGELALSPGLSVEASVVIVHSAAAAEAWAELTRGEVHEPAEACCGPGQAHAPRPPRLTHPDDLKIVAASPAAAEALRARGVQVYAVASEPSASGVVDAALAAAGA